MFQDGSTTRPWRQTSVRPPLDGERVFVLGWGQAEHSFERRQPMVALAYPHPHDTDGLEDHGPYLLPDGRSRPAGRRPARTARPARPARAASPAARPAAPAGQPLQTARAAGVYRRRRLLVAAGVAFGVWLSAAAVGGLTTALRGLESRPLTVPELAGAGQLASSTTPVQASATALWGAGGASEATGSLHAGEVYVVQPGETFWDIARRLQPTGDIRPLVDRLVKAHGSSPLQIGEHLVLP